MRRLLLILALVLGLSFFLSRVTQLDQLWETVLRGNARWLLLGVALQGVWLVNTALSFQSIYRLLGIQDRLSHLLQVAAAANFMNIVMPSMGVGGMTVFMVDGQRRDLPSGRVSGAVALYVLYEYVAFLIVLALGLFVLFQRDQLNAPEIAASLLFALAAAALAMMIYAAARNGHRLERFLTRLATAANRLLRPILNRDYFSLERARSFPRELSAGLGEMRRSRGGVLLPAALALSSKALLIAILSLVFLAFHQPHQVGTVIAAFSIGYLFKIVSPTPSGIGFVEGAMALALTSMGVAAAPAAVIALSYRGISFWLPLFYGLIAFRWVGRPAPA